MIRQSNLIALAVASGMLCSCAVTAPTRPAHTGADNVGVINTNQLVGTWSSRILNPLEGEDGNTTTFTFAPDGTLTGTTTSSSVPQGLAFSMSGSWKIEGEQLSTTIESMDETSGNPMAALMKGLVSSMMKDRTSMLNIYEASQTRLVVVAEDTGQAQEWVRVN